MSETLFQLRSLASLQLWAQASVAPRPPKPSDTTEEPPPLPPPLGPPPEFLTKEVVVSSEASGAILFGKQGTDYSQGRYHVVTSSGTVKPLEWPKWTSLSRKDCQRFLQTLFYYPDYTMPENNGDLSTTCVDFLPVTVKTNLSEDQQLWLVQKKDELSVNMVDPGLSYMLRQHTEDQREVRLQAILDSTKPFRSALLPVFASDHWNLLVCHKESAEQALGFTWRLYDSLSVPMKAQQEAQILLGSLLDSEFVLPERANSAVQPEGSNLCGWYCLSYAEQEVRLLRKEWLRMHALELAPTWKERLLKLSTHLQKELGLREKELATMAEKAQKAKTEAEKRAQVNKKALEAMKDLTSPPAKTAQEALKKNTLRFTWEDLSKEALAKISELEHSPKICARCRWQSSCLSCDPYKALRYWVASEARDKKKILRVSREAF